jgi:Uma2 family endonuclease
MTQNKTSDSPSQANEHEPREDLRGTRIDSITPEVTEHSIPRLGRRESEPHSAEITYLYDVLTTNFPESRAVWDLHHYFELNEKEIDVQLDISFFLNWSMPYTLSSYKAKDYENRIPSMAINVLSKSTWREDFIENVDKCRLAQIPLYVVFSPFLVTSEIYAPPFLRLYILQEDGSYKQIELHQTTLPEGGEINADAILDTEGIVPFRFGLMELNQKHIDGKALFRLVLIHSEELQLLLSSKEQLILKMDQAHQETEQALQELEKYKAMFGKIDEN